MPEKRRIPPRLVMLVAFVAFAMLAEEESCVLLEPRVKGYKIEMHSSCAMNHSLPHHVHKMRIACLIMCNESQQDPMGTMTREDGDVNAAAPTKN